MRQGGSSPGPSRLRVGGEAKYISNVVNRRLPRNRPPRRGEVALFLPYLMREIDIVRPRVLCLLGATAVKALLNWPLAEVLGQVLIKNGFGYFCTYHPTAAIYDIDPEGVFMRHIVYLKTIVDSWPKPAMRSTEPIWTHMAREP